MKTILLVLLTSFLVIVVVAQDFSGTYVSETQTGNILLKLEKNATGIYSGSLSGNNDEFHLNGKLEDSNLIGTVGEEDSHIVFLAELSQNILTLTMAERDSWGNINPATAQIVQFQRSDEITKQKTNTQKDIVINNIVLNETKVQEIISTYGVEPLPGRYWYDKVSGLYGVEGYDAYGYMYAGHDFGELSRNASNGNSGVIINGRDLSATEWAVWSYILGYYIQTGAYWFDDKGNAGYEGYDVPLVNLFTAAQQNAYSGQGGSGDNFWSSRFGAGNSDQGGSRGYVSVPGHGPIGYGF